MERYGNLSIIALSVLAIAVAGGTLVATAKLIGDDASKTKESHSNDRLPRPKTGYDQLVGNTPMIKLHNLSRILNRHIFVKVCMHLLYIFILFLSPCK